MEHLHDHDQTRLYRQNLTHHCRRDMYLKITIIQHVGMRQWPFKLLHTSADALALGVLLRAPVRAEAIWVREGGRRV